MLSVISQQLLETRVTVFHCILPKNFLESFPLNPLAHFQQIRGNRIMLDANRPTETIILKIFKLLWLWIHVAKKLFRDSNIEIFLVSTLKNLLRTSHFVWKKQKNLLHIATARKKYSSTTINYYQISHRAQHCMRERHSGKSPSNCFQSRIHEYQPEKSSYVSERSG